MTKKNKKQKQKNSPSTLWGVDKDKCAALRNSFPVDELKMQIESDVTTTTLEVLLINLTTCIEESFGNNVDGEDEEDEEDEDITSKLTKKAPV